MTQHERAQQETARRLGYGDGPEAVARLNADHDPYHRELSRLLGRDFSPTLRWVETGQLAHPLRSRHDDAIGFEEALTLEAQRWTNTGEYGETMRVLWWFGLDPESVRRLLLEAGRP